MKTKVYAISPDGDVHEVPHFGIGMYSSQVHAANKTEAAKLLLARAARMFEHGSPRLRIRDGAFLLVWHNGHEFIAESGTIDRANCPLCLAGYATERDALNDRSFAYYASEEYRSAAGKSISEPALVQPK